MTGTDAKFLSHDDDRPVRRRAPTHPGRILDAHYLQPRQITEAALGRLVGRSATFVSRLVNSAAGARIDRDLAEKLSEVFNTTPEFWFNLQAASDAWDIRN